MDQKAEEETKQEDSSVAETNDGTSAEDVSEENEDAERDPRVAASRYAYWEVPNPARSSSYPKILQAKRRGQMEAEMLLNKHKPKQVIKALPLEQGLLIKLSLKLELGHGFKGGHSL